MSTQTLPIIVLKTGKTAQEIKAGKSNFFKVKAGDSYRVVTEADDKLLANVIAKRRGDDLHLEYADGTAVTLESYYAVCKTTASCNVTLPSDSAAGYMPGNQSAAGVALGDGYSMVYAHGEPYILMGMDPGN
jgi:hypothetical protein